MSKIELIIDTIDKKGDDILFLHPEHMNGAKFCASNTFDKATINNCPTEKLSSGNLIGIYNTLKPGAEISVTVFQPIAIMLPYDSKQIEANLQLVGFENIEINEKYVTVKKGIPSTTIVVVSATKPLGKVRQDTDNEKKNDKNIEKIIEKKENKYFEEKKPKKIVFRVERAAYFALRSRVKKDNRPKRLKISREVNEQVICKVKKIREEIKEELKEKPYKKEIIKRIKKEEKPIIERSSEEKSSEEIMEKEDKNNRTEEKDKFVDDGKLAKMQKIVEKEEKEEKEERGEKWEKEEKKAKEEEREKKETKEKEEKEKKEDKIIEKSKIIVKKENENDIKEKNKAIEYISSNEDRKENIGLNDNIKEKNVIIKNKEIQKEITAKETKEKKKRDLKKRYGKH